MYVRALFKKKRTGQSLSVKQELLCTEDKRQSHQQVNESLNKGNEVPVFMEMEALSIQVCFQGSNLKITPSGWFGSFIWYPEQ